jgi:hypothetical protein
MARIMVAPKSVNSFLSHVDARIPAGIGYLLA